jgi:hypothetical protein
MGQQQLLLLVMGIVVVAVAVVAGLDAFNDSSAKFAEDNLVNRNLAIAGSATFWKAKNDPYEGGNAEYTGFTLQKVGMAGDTPVGKFAIKEADGQKLVIVGVAKDHPGVGVKTYVNGDDIDSTVVAHDGSIALP